MGYREEKPEEDRQARTLEIVLDDQPDWMRGHQGILTVLAPVPYALSNDSFRPHRVGLAPRAERERRLLT